MNKLSVVIVSLVGGPALLETLEALKAKPAEYVVMVNDDKNDVEALRQKFTSMSFVARNNLSVPMARKRGVELTGGEIVALLEDTSLPVPGWHDALLTAFSQTGTVAVGGPVILSPKLGGSSLALGCGEYGRFHPDRFALLGDEPVNENGLLSVTRLPGNNLAYRREALMELLSGNENGLIEGEINEQLKQRGFKLYMHPGMLVSYSAKDAHGGRLKTRFNHGRLFAGNRVAGQSWMTRFSWFLKSMLLPVVLSIRGWSSMVHAVEKLAWPKVMVWIFLMETAWAMGEAVGYLKGRGRSLEAWR